MNQNETAILRRTGFNPARQFVSALWKYRALWMIPTALCTMLAVFIALFGAKSYEARQTLVVRDDMVGSAFKPGRFDSMDSMKSAQETILEIARRPQVIRKALEQLGPPHQTPRRTWPTDLAIEQTQGMIHISAPNGAEFGKTEAIVLTVKQPSKKRAAKFIERLLDVIETNLREFRALRFKSMEEELAQGTLVAKHAYELAVSKLQTYENQFGSDLATLRSLNDNLTGSNELMGTFTEMKAERRAAETDVDNAQKQLDLLIEAQNDSNVLVAASRELLQLQPTLTSRIEGLNKALLRLSTDLGKYAENHPKIATVRREIKDIKAQIHSELGASIGSLKSQLALRIQKRERLNEKIGDYESRLINLADKRVEYQKLSEEVRKKQEVFGNSESALGEIQSLGAAALNISLLTRVDKPQVAYHAVGPTKKMIVFGGMAAGLLIGLGLVMFFAPIDISEQPFPPQAAGYQSTGPMPWGTHRATVTQPNPVDPTALGKSATVPPTPAPAFCSTPATAPADPSPPVAGSSTKTPAAMAQSKRTQGTPPPAKPPGTTRAASQGVATDLDKTNPETASRPAVPKEISKPVIQHAHDKTTTSVSDVPAADFASPATKALFDEISTRLKSEKPRNPSLSGSAETPAASTMAESQYAQLDAAAQAALDSNGSKDNESAAKIGDPMMKGDFGSSAAPMRTIPMTEPRRSSPTVPFSPDSLAATFNNTGIEPTTGLPSETSIPESSDTNGVQEGESSEQKNPQDRRKAKTVNLRDLKKQLSTKPQGVDQKNYERNIADSIRACDQDEIRPSSKDAKSTSEKLSEQIDRLTKSISDVSSDDKD